MFFRGARVAAAPDEGKQLPIQRFLWLVLVLLAGCSGEGASGLPSTRSGPVSVRGWIGEVIESGERYAAVSKVNEALRRAEMLSTANVYVEGVQYASGGIAPDGSFIILDVPPGSARIRFQIAGVGDSTLAIDEIPPNADVLIPNITVRAGSASVADASKVKVRIAGDARRSTGRFANVGGQRVEVIEVPITDLADRRDFPSPAAEGPKPLAIVK